MFGQSRLMNAAIRNESRGRSLIDAVLADLLAFMEQRPLADDLTLLIAERVPAATPSSRPISTANTR